MGWVSLVALGVAGLASMRAALDRGDVDEAARQGALAGPAVVEQALTAGDRATRLSAIAAAPLSSGRIELLAPLARAAQGPDRRIAIPAAKAARAIAIELSQHDLPDDLAPADLVHHRHAWTALALDRERWISLRVFALDTAAALDRLATSGIGVALPSALTDPDPSFRRAVLDVVPMPVPPAMRAALASTVARDVEPHVALAAAAVLCADLALDRRSRSSPRSAPVGSRGCARWSRSSTRRARRCGRRRAA